MTTPPMRPMSLGDMFDTAFKLYRRHFLTFIGIVALLQIPLAIIQFLVQFTFGNRALQNWMRFAQRPPVLGSGQNPFDLIPFGDLATLIGIGLVAGLVQFLIVRNLVTGALANAISRSYNREPVSIIDAYRFGARRFFSLIGASLATFFTGVVLLGLIFGCSFGVIFALSQSRGNSPGVFAALLVILLVFGAFVLFAIGALFVYTRLLVTTQAIVLEGHGPLAGIARSWRLIGGAFWRSLGVMVLMGILTYIIAQFPTLIVSFSLSLASRGSLDALMTNQAITALVAQIGTLIALPLQLAVYTLLYYDLRVRKEGYDIELMARQAAV